MKFKVGQKIRMVRNESEAQVGDTGIIQALPCSSSPTYDSYAVEFPCFAGTDWGHNCHGLVPSNNGHWISKNRMELASEQEANMYKIGDSVRIKSKQKLAKLYGNKMERFPYEWYEEMWDVVGKQGDILRINNSKLSVFIKFSTYTAWWFPWDCLEDTKEEHMKITIETDGHHKTTAECNGVTAESLCNPADEFKLPKGVYMAVQRLLDKLGEDTSFHVGDIVEVVANEVNFRGNPIGLQGIVKWSNESGASVKLPTRDKPLTFYNRELKLIRRGNNYEQL